MLILILLKPSILASAAVTIVSDIAVTVTVVYSLRKERAHFQRLVLTAMSLHVRRSLTVLTRGYLEHRALSTGLFCIV